MLVAVTVVTFLTFHLLRPESFAGDGRPLLAQLGDYLWRAAHGDLGRSWDPRLGDNDDVATLVWRGLPGDAALVAGGLLAGGVLGIAAGAYCAARRETAGARTLQAGALLLLCAPVYWVGLMLILVFGPGIGPLGVSLFALPGTYRPLTEDPAAWLHALVVPWLVIGAPIGAMALRMTRAAMGDVLEEDFMRTAAAKGLRERTIIRRHAVPAAAAPAVALVGANTALVVTNAILVEQVFDIPGVFRMSTQAMAKGDFPLLQGIVITGALLVVTASFVVDAIHAWLDPRIRA